MRCNTFALAAFAAGVSAQFTIPDSLDAICSDSEGFESCAATAITALPPCFTQVDLTDEEAALPCLCSALTPASDCIVSACGDSAASLAAAACGGTATGTGTGTADVTATDDSASETATAETSETEAEDTGASSTATATDAEDTADASSTGDTTTVTDSAAANGFMASGVFAGLFAGAVALL
ncbi:hypothetical protein MKZ38_006483 [Zalerion maritima]|uniref:Uncharacterized protein n=1 Tax=Zalerion maritima TaxID=339359 RepID=A0AAD5S6G7_9PEZI|nr:hypothetical protein MKZ38_006483 [Zalerion maritima]